MAEKRSRRDFTAREALELLSYDAKTGVFRWKAATMSFGGPKPAGHIAGSISDGGYRIIMVFGRKYRASHLAWLIMKGSWPHPALDVDHKNRCRDQDWWLNLRQGARAQNNMNSKLHVSNKSGVKGVSWRKDTGKWHARIGVKDRIILLGDYFDKSSAIAARRATEKLHYGEFSPL